MAMARRGGAIAMAGVALAVAHPAAQADAVDEVAAALSWRAPASCPDGAAVARLVAAQLSDDGDAELGDAMAGARIEAAISGNGRRWRMELHLRIGDADGERVLDAPSCAELAEAAALIIALAIEPMLSIAADASGPAGDGATTTATTDAVAATPTATATTPPQGDRGTSDDLTPPTEARLENRGAPSSSGVEEIRLSAAAGFDAGTMPDAGPGVRAEVELGFGVWSFGLIGNYWFEQRAALAGDPPRGGDIHIISAGARLCRHLVGALAGCAGAEIGWMNGRAFGFDEDDPELIETQRTQLSVVFVDAIYRIGLLPRLSLRFDLQVGVAPLRAALRQIDSDTLIHQSGLLVARSFGGLEVTIP